MKTLITAAMAISMMSSTAIAAQPPAWNGADFWRGGPADAWSRISYLQQRIDAGMRDRSLTAAEGRRARAQLRRIRDRAWRMRRRDGGRLNAVHSADLQARLDNLGSRIRWLRHNGVGARDFGAGDRYAINYDASRYYRPGRYAERRLTARDQIYRGSDGRYYCRRGNGTIGLVVGAAAGALLGNAIDGGSNRVAGTLIGGALGALAGQAVDRGEDIRCR